MTIPTQSDTMAPEKVGVAGSRGETWWLRQSMDSGTNSVCKIKTFTTCAVVVSSEFLNLTEHQFPHP